MRTRQGSSRFHRAFPLALLILAAMTLAVPGQGPESAEQPRFSEACTSIMVGRLATVDGSVITSQTCDGNYRTWVRIEPSRKHADGAKTKIYAGLLHNETPWDTRRVNVQGEIPQVAETYAFLNTAYPCLNEKQLAIGETTIGGRRELRNTEGMFLIEEIQRMMLERCTTAREAIKLAGELVEKYGYCDFGECLTIAVEPSYKSLAIGLLKPPNPEGSSLHIQSVFSPDFQIQKVLPLIFGSQRE